MTGWVRFVYDVLLVLGLVAGVVYITAHSWWFPWWTHPFGRHMVSFSITVTGIYGYLVMRTFWPNMPNGLRVTIAIGLFTALTANQVWRAVLMIRLALKEKRKDRERRSRTTK